MLIAAVFGKGAFYYVYDRNRILLVSSLSANTAFADFPRLCRSISQNNYFAARIRAARGGGWCTRRGSWVLGYGRECCCFCSEAVTDRLIPLYAVGAVSGVPLSQAGMVRHLDWKARGPALDKIRAG